MKKKLLDERLFACAEFVRERSVLADIGTDHAYLPVSLILDGKIDFALACDINEKPLEKAKYTALKYNVFNKISFRLCDGLNAISKDEFSDLVIAGMGGEMIAKILCGCPYIKSEKYNLILQPMSKANVLRKFLCENGFEILQEKAVISNGKIYSVINAKFSRDIKKCDLLFEYLGALQKQNDENAIAYKKKIKHSLLKKAKGILSADSENEQAKMLLETAEKIKV